MHEQQPPHNRSPCPQGHGAEPANRGAYANELKYMRDYIIMLGRLLMRALAAPSPSSYNSEPAVAPAGGHAPSLPCGGGHQGIGGSHSPGARARLRVALKELKKRG